MKAKTHSALKRQAKGSKPQPDMIMLHGIPYYQLHLTDPKQPKVYARFILDNNFVPCAQCRQTISAAEDAGPLCWFCDLEAADDLANSYNVR